MATEHNETLKHPKINLNKLRRKISHTFFQDGLVDILLGYIFIILGINEIISYDILLESGPSHPWVATLILIPGIAVFIVCKFFVVRSRQGIIIRKKRSKEFKLIYYPLYAIFTLVISWILFFFILGTLSNRVSYEGAGLFQRIFHIQYQNLQLYSCFMVAGTFFTIFAAIALLAKYYRMFIHAAVFSISGFFYQYLKGEYWDCYFNENCAYFFIPKIYAGVIAIFAGFIIVVMGIILFTKFLNTHPKVSNSELGVDPLD